MSFFHNSLTLPPRCDVQEAQQTRITCLQRYSEMVDSESRDELRLMRLCEDLTILHFLTCQPPDRVGVIRRLSLNSDAATLVQHGPDWVIDLTKFRYVLYCNTRLTDCDILVIGTRPPNSTVHPVTTLTLLSLCCLDSYGPSGLPYQSSLATTRSSHPDQVLSLNHSPVSPEAYSYPSPSINIYIPFEIH